MSFIDLQITNLLWCNLFHHRSLHSHCHHHRPNGSLGYICHWNNWNWLSKQECIQPTSSLPSPHVIWKEVILTTRWWKIIRGETVSYEILSIYFWYWVLSSVIEKGMINQSSTFPMSSGKIISIFILLCFWLNANH